MLQVTITDSFAVYATSQGIWFIRIWW